LVEIWAAFRWVELAGLDLACLQLESSDVLVCKCQLDKPLLWEHLCSNGLALSLLQAQTRSNYYTWLGETMYCAITFS